MIRQSDLILLDVAQAHATTVDDLRSPSTVSWLAKARHEACYRLYAARLPSGAFRWSLSQIGGFLGGRDQTTVRHGAKRYALGRGLPFPRSVA